MAISVELPEDMEKALDEKAEKEFYANRSEVIRAALRQFLNKDKSSKAEEVLLVDLIKKGLLISEDELSEKEKERLKKFE